MITFYSTNHNAKEVGIKQAILNGLAEDGGLYMPKEIPLLSSEEIDSFSNIEYWEIAYAIFQKYLSGIISNDVLKSICIDCYNFNVPIEKLTDKIQVMWLTNGPTAAFKDFAALVMARIMQDFLAKDDRELLILTATSGDTGSAVANAFYGLGNVKVVVLFPEKEVSERQRRLMTTLGKNITAIAIDGKFDDCQDLVKRAFMDGDLKYLELSSANSINFARLMPQIVYYAYAYSRIGKVNFSVPSGNFGDIMGGLIAKKMGVPCGKFIAAVNENNEFLNFFNTGKYEKISPSKNCISNAMNVGHPSNFARLVSLYGREIDEKGNMKKSPDIKKIKEDIWTYSVTDKETKDEIKLIYDKFGKIIEPHGAVGIFAYEKYLEYVYGKNLKDDLVGVCLETADPAKFPEVIREVINVDPLMPESMKKVLLLKEDFEKMDNDYNLIKEFLIKRFSK